MSVLAYIAMCALCMFVVVGLMVWFEGPLYDFDEWPDHCDGDWRNQELPIEERIKKLEADLVVARAANEKRQV